MADGDSRVETAEQLPLPIPIPIQPETPGLHPSQADTTQQATQAVPAFSVRYTTAEATAEATPTRILARVLPPAFLVLLPPVTVLIRRQNSYDRRELTIWRGSRGGRTREGRSEGRSETRLRLRRGRLRAADSEFSVANEGLRTTVHG